MAGILLSRAPPRSLPTNSYRNASVCCWPADRHGAISLNKRQARTPNGAHLDVAVDYQHERDDVLATMQKAFGAVDRVEGPASRTEASTAIADPCHDPFDRGVRDDLTNDLRNLPGEIRIGAQQPTGCGLFRSCREDFQATARLKPHR
jgi:hypothetical protein